MLTIVIPYRNREEHLKKFLEDVPSKINVDNFNILVVEQLDDKPFNRAKLLNIGFDYSKDFGNQFCFHDVDMIPIKADYSQVTEPVHLVAKATQFGGKIPGHNYYGGVNMVNKESFIKLNGYSNDFWGWGGEDDDMLLRVYKNGYSLVRRYGEFKSLAHKYNGPNHKHYNDNVKKLNQKYDYNGDGLNTLNYELVGVEQLNEICKLIKVKI
jgi:predicted glycosyltransferase involved in capsule biosynthesis